MKPITIEIEVKYQIFEGSKIAALTMSVPLNQDNEMLKCLKSKEVIFGKYMDNDWPESKENQKAYRTIRIYDNNWDSLVNRAKELIFETANKLSEVKESNVEKPDNELHSIIL